MQEEISVNMKGKLQSYIRHLFENLYGPPRDARGNFSEHEGEVTVLYPASL
jgi:hypothetical protein